MQGPWQESGGERRREEKEVFMHKVDPVVIKK